MEPQYSKSLLYSYILGKMIDKNSKYKNIYLEDMLSLVSVLSTENIWMNVSKIDYKGQEKKI